MYVCMIHTYIHTYTHTYTYVYTHTHTHTHTFMHLYICIFVQGVLQPRFTVVGESMTEAAILEKTGQPDAVHCSQGFLQRLAALGHLSSSEFERELAYSKTRCKTEAEEQRVGADGGGQGAHFQKSLGIVAYSVHVLVC